MSRMSKFLRQQCLYEQARRNSKGEVLLDDYGDILYMPAKRVHCRRERVTRDVQTSTGAILRSATRYFLDDSVPLKTEDRLDGKAVLEVEDYISPLGTTAGYECYV